MIYTVTLNPSIDYIVRLEKLVVGSLNRMESEDKFVGGKGINVSRILKNLGVKSVALGFLGGFTGEFIMRQLDKELVDSSFTKIVEDTRINIKLKSDSETEINGTGPKISDEEFINFLGNFNSLTNNDIVVLSGSVPKSLGNQVYQKIIEKILVQGSSFVMDVEGVALLNSLEHTPLVVKPNHHELSEMFETTLNTRKDLIIHGKKLLAMGAQNVLISMAGDGALMLTKKEVYFSPAIKGTVKNSVGAGDAMLAGFIGEFSKSKDVRKSFKLGVACGAATAFSDDLAKGEMIGEMLKKVEVVQVEDCRQ